MEKVGIGIIGGGLMGKELASAMGRWFVLEGLPVQPELVAVCDMNPAALDWFRRVPTVKNFANDYRAVLSDAQVQAVYVAIPHDQHERVYIDTLQAGKDLLAEKPFGIDAKAAGAIAEAARKTGRFVRVSSEFPFLPGAYRAYKIAKSGSLGRLLEVHSGFHHSSDLDPRKPVNWKRQAKHCGEIGVMGDLGMHALHLPLKLGWEPLRVYAQLQKIYTERPDGKGGMAPCDTWDNAMLHTDILVDGREVPMRVEMKRLSPGDTNHWFFEVLGTDGGVRYSTKEPRTVWIFERGTEQSWRRVDLGFETPFATITGKIFEPGFPDCLQQMLAAFVAERAGALGDRLACVTPGEAVRAHNLFAAALLSYREKKSVAL